MTLKILLCWKFSNGIWRWQNWLSSVAVTHLQNYLRCQGSTLPPYSYDFPECFVRQRDLHFYPSALRAGGVLSSSGRGRRWNFDQLQCLGPRPEILDRYISLSCLRWLPTACHERLAYFHWPQWVTWLVTWWVTWSRSPDAGRHIGKFSLWTTLLRFSRSAQISLFSNFTKLGQLFFDNIFFGLTS